MKIEIKNKVEEIDQSKVLIGREFNHVVFHFSKFHNNNIIQLTSSAGPVVNTTLGGLHYSPTLIERTIIMLIQENNLTAIEWVTYKSRRILLSLFYKIRNHQNVFYQNAPKFKYWELKIH